MIDLTRLNGHRLIVNSDLIKFIEATPDTTLTLITGEKLIVRESCDQVLYLTGQWRRHIFQQGGTDPARSIHASLAQEAIHKSSEAEDD